MKGDIKRREEVLPHPILTNLLATCWRTFKLKNLGKFTFKKSLNSKIDNLDEIDLFNMADK